ncbi:MAG: exodeoxyribonuclease VII small subunit [Spirochaetales bacterium]|nr:exodeoxyribonuclease VII small subunit [Spirochaetales bacterium]
MKNFEEKMARLEELSRVIKDRETPLEKAVSSFDEGVKLAAQLEKELQKVEKKVEILLNEPEPARGDEPELGLFDQ